MCNLELMRLTLILSILVPILSFTQTKNFRGTFDELQTEAKRVDKPYIVEFYASWCGYCKKFDREVMTDSGFYNTVNSKMLFQKINGEIDTQTASQFKIKGYPTFIVFAPDGTVVKKMSGYTSTSEFQKIFDQLELDKNNQYNFTNYRASKSISISNQKETLELSTIGEDIYQKYLKEFSLIDCEELIIDTPEQEKYIKFYYDYANKGFNMVEAQQAYESNLISEKEINYLFNNYILDKNSADRGDLSFINLLLARQPENIDLIDTKAYILLELSNEKDAKSLVTSNKKTIKKTKINYEPTQELDKLIK